jgi:hypothetical protein
MARLLESPEPPGEKDRQRMAETTEGRAGNLPPAYEGGTAIRTPPPITTKAVAEQGRPRPGPAVEDASMHDLTTVSQDVAPDLRPDGTRTRGLPISDRYKQPTQKELTRGWLSPKGRRRGGED